MNLPKPPPPAWYCALTLTERAATLHPSSDTPPPVADAAQATRRLERWRARSPLRDDARFAQRLAAEGLEENVLLSLLGEPIESVQKRLAEPPRWMVELSAALTGTVSPLDLPLPEAVRQTSAAGFLVVIAPLIQRSLTQLRAGLDALAAESITPLFDPATAQAALFVHLPAELIGMLRRTLMLELNVARIQGELEGDSAEMRFQSFLRRLADPAVVQALFEEYPLLARRVAARLDAWVEVSLELVSRLCADRAAIEDAFNQGQPLGQLVQVRTGMGDAHRGGRSVTIVTFEGGLRIVYKPRSLSADLHFQQLLDWINQRDDVVAFRTLRIIDREAHGWMEFVSPSDCASEKEIERFYRRQGGQLALLYVLEATDFHFQNVIAAGEHPMLVDLESLLHPHLRVASARSRYQTKAEMFRSVLGVGLLPQRVWANAASAGIDISGLSNLADQVSPRAVPQMAAAGTDQMHLVRKRKTMGRGQNRPTLRGADVDLLAYADALLTGFTRIYELLLAERDALCAEDGPLARFQNDEVRVLVRPTLFYASVLEDFFHPDALRDAVELDRFCDRIWVGSEYYPFFLATAVAEREALERGDIPMFTARPCSRDLWSGSGERISGVFDETGMSLVKRRIERLSTEDLARQRWFIRASLATLSADIDTPSERVASRPEPRTAATRERLIAAAIAVGERIEALVLPGAGESFACGLTLGRQRRWTLEPLGIDLYAGLPGIALALAQLEAVSGHPSFGASARHVLAMLERRIEEERPYLTSVGGFDGWGGILYTMAHLGLLWDRPDLLHQAETIAAEVLPPLIAKDERASVLSGSAGALAALAGLWRRAPSRATQAALILCGEQLLAKAQPMAPGLGWASPEDPAVTGFARGAAGIAWALLEQGALTGEARFGKAACQALAYERSLFVPEEGRWLDRAAGQHRAGWCHGAAGIGLGRLRSLPHLDDEEVRREIAVALASTASERGFGRDHSLCHGELGDLELLLEARSRLGEPQWALEVELRTALLLEDIESTGWRCGVPLRLETPGLMNGLAGVAYGLLRLAEPARVPSVLALELPSGSPPPA